MQRRSLLAIAAATPLLTACWLDDDDAPATPAAPIGTIVDVAKANPDFSILVEAVTAAGLGATLSGAGPFTVFAPTNAAFGALLTELGVTKAALLDNKPLLTAVLTYHVLGARVLKAGVPAGKAIVPVGGGFFKIDAKGADLVFQDGRNRSGKLVATDVAATNGVIHAIDKVMLPADKNIVETAIATPDFSILVEAVTAAGLGAPLSGAGPLTVFAPTNAAFAALLTELNVTKEALLANVPLLTAVLTYHVVPARVLAADITFGQAVTTLQSETLTIGTGFVITDQRARTAKIAPADVFTSNGVIHVIDKVILPKA
jgi:uncharacterized surface protein with fasciclin (FAS1) repeats